APIAPVSREYAISTSPGFASVFVDGAQTALSWPMKVRLKEGGHRFVVVSPIGKRTFSYEVRRDDPVHTLVLRSVTGELVARATGVARSASERTPALPAGARGRQLRERPVESIVEVGPHSGAREHVDVRGVAHLRVGVIEVRSRVAGRVGH